MLSFFFHFAFDILIFFFLVVFFHNNFIKKFHLRMRENMNFWLVMSGNIPVLYKNLYFHADKIFIKERPLFLYYSVR